MTCWFSVPDAAYKSFTQYRCNIKDILWKASQSSQSINLSLCHVLLWGEALAIGHRFALVAYLFCATDLYTEDRTKWHFHALRSIFTWPQCVLTLCTVVRQNWPNKMHKKMLWPFTVRVQIRDKTIELYLKAQMHKLCILKVYIGVNNVIKNTGFP